MSITSESKIGVMSVMHEGRPPFGMQTYFFEDMIQSVPDMENGIFFFSPLDWERGVDEVVGYKYVSTKWVKMTCTIPAIVYDRSFSSDAIQKQKIEKCRQYLRESNRLILNPLALVEVLNDKPAFHRFMMDHWVTTLNTYPFDFLMEDRFIGLLDDSRYYIKPSFGSKGAGIYVIEKENGDFILFDNLGEEVRFAKFSLLVDHLRDTIEDVAGYMIQKEAKIVWYENAPWDIRVLVQNYGESYKVTGKAVRLGQKHSMTSNLNSGGNALPFHELDAFYQREYGITSDALNEQIDRLCLDCSEKLKERFGDFCEIGFDVLMTKDKGPIILEGNAKPSRWVFVKIADYLEAQNRDNQYFVDRRRETVRVPMLYASYVLRSAI